MFWHTTYLGLGYLTNPYVPAWRDSVAVEYVQAIDPTAIYGGKEYEALLRSRVEEIVHFHPRLIFYTVAAKAGVLCCMLLLSVNIGLAAAILSPKPPGTEIAFGLAMITAALPGIIAIPEPQYVIGMITLSLLYWYYSLAFYVERCSSAKTARGAVTGTDAPSPHSLQVEALLSTYPRPRPELSPEQRANYVEHYRSNRAARQGLPIVVAKLESWMHRRVSEGLNGGNLLEIGAGNLNHLPYLPGHCVYAAVEPFQELLEDSPYRSRAQHIYRDLEEVPQTARYDCIFSIAVLEHLTDLPFVLARAGLLLGEGGTFRAGFPSEGGLLWGLAWRLTTGIEYRLRRGFDYGAIMRHEHLNTASEIITLLGHFYEYVEISRFPLSLDHLSFYTTAIAYRPRLDRCRSFQAFRSASGVVAHE
jgi:SAM-dependent methyltransferase